MNAVPRYPDAEGSAASGSLVGKELFLSQLAAPEGAQGAVGRPGDRVFIDSRGGSEEAGDEVIAAGRSPAGDDDSADRDVFQEGEIRLQGADSFFRIHLNQIIELALADILCFYLQGFQKAGRGFGRL